MLQLSFSYDFKNLLKVDFSKEKTLKIRLAIYFLKMKKKVQLFIDLLFIANRLFQQMTSRSPPSFLKFISLSCKDTKKVRTLGTSTENADNPMWKSQIPSAPGPIQHLWGGPGLSSWLLARAWPSPNSCSHMRGKPVIRRPHTLSLSAFQENKLFVIWDYHLKRISIMGILSFQTLRFIMKL